MYYIIYKMGRYRGPLCRLCRREGRQLFLKGSRCDTEKCAFKRRGTSPGEPPKKGISRASGYAIRLREKQKAKRIYGVSESQFKKYFKLAFRKKGITGELLLQFLERRLDNIIYRLGFSSSRRSARQLVSHGHFLVNDRKVNIPSYLVVPGDKITVREKSKKMITEILKDKRPVPEWLSLDQENLEGSVKYLPKREEIPIDVREELIIEFYS